MPPKKPRNAHELTEAQQDVLASSDDRFGLAGGNHRATVSALVARGLAAEGHPHHLTGLGRTLAQQAGVLVLGRVLKAAKPELLLPPDVGHPGRHRVTAVRLDDSSHLWRLDVEFAPGGQPVVVPADQLHFDDQTPGVVRLWARRAAERNTGR